MEQTRIFVKIVNLNADTVAEFVGGTPEMAHKALKSALRKVKVPIMRLYFLHEATFRDELHILYKTHYAGAEALVGNA